MAGPAHNCNAVCESSAPPNLEPVTRSDYGEDHTRRGPNELYNSNLRVLSACGSLITGLIFGASEPGEQEANTCVQAFFRVSVHRILAHHLAYPIVV